ncbi:MAG: AMP-binding protein [Alphaproteobacteria bacterium]|nr:AMP-binding protein [Alphaproteobacteria bacterium]
MSKTTNTKKRRRIMARFFTALARGILRFGLRRWLVKRLLNFLYKIEINGMENFKNLPGGALIVVNHTSFLDAALLWVYLPRDVFFAVNSNAVNGWWTKHLLRLGKPLLIDPTNPASAKSIIDELKNGGRVIIFPESRVSTTGGLMKVFPGPAVIADHSDADILPICIEGLQYSAFGYFAKRLRVKHKAKVSMTVLPARKLNVGEDDSGRDRRVVAVEKLQSMMCEMKFLASNLDQSLFEKMVDASHLVGTRKEVLEDINRKPLTYKKIFTGIFALGSRFKKDTAAGEHVGLMMPNSNAGAVAFFAIQAAGRVPCMINFSAGRRNVVAACQVAGLKIVYTARQFVEKADLGEIVEAMTEAGVRIVYLEDVKAELGLGAKLGALWKRRRPLRYAARTKGSDPAVILFTSGSEGKPKGIVLSHSNILANCFQATAIFDLGVLDVYFGSMPIFHSLGMTGCMVLPLVTGAKVFMYPSPLHYRIVPEMIYESNATIFYGTDTFVNNYAKVAHPYDFHSVRYVVAGAEKVKDETFNVWCNDFGHRIIEGYGATETAPLLSINTPMHFRKGTVGRLLPGIQARLEPVEGITQGGRLVVKGPNVMLGYVKPDSPYEIVPPVDGWYDTGDIVEIDDDGYVKIVGRAKRFAKIAGEMVSLPAVEAEMEKLRPEFSHAAVAVPDERKGERIILFTTDKTAERSAVAKDFRAAGVGELSTPSEVRFIEEIPLMGSGKTNYVLLNEMALEPTP